MYEPYDDGALEVVEAPPNQSEADAAEVSGLPEAVEVPEAAAVSAVAEVPEVAEVEPTEG
jgi:hypothetical protein